MLRVLLSLFLCLPLASQACEKVENLFAQRSVQEFPNQGGLMWCFAFATAKLINFETGQNVNPYSLAKNGHQRDGQLFSPLQALRVGGYIHSALQTAETRGYCRNDLDEAGYQSLERLQMHFNGEAVLSGPEQYQQSERLNHSIEANCSRRQLTRLTNRSGQKFDGRLIRLILNPKHPDFIPSVDPEAAFNKAMKVLEIGQPLALGYFKNRSYNHAAVIVGREKNPQSGVCEYLLSDSEVNCENSHGPDCEKQIYRLSEEELRATAIEVNFFWPKRVRVSN